jgi:hypothetical protein
MSNNAATIVGPTRLSASTEHATNTTRALLVCGAVAGPLFILASLIQALFRPGHDLSHQEVSLLSLGSSGWIQVSNFLIAGALFIAGAFGVRRFLHDGPGQKWAPLLMGAIGVGMAAGGVFRVDPSSGYPIGSAAGASATANWHGTLHTVFGSLAFLALVVLCFVLRGRFAATGERSWAACSRIAGVLCAIGIASGGAPRGSLTLFIGVGIAMVWVALASAHFRSDLGQVAVKRAHFQDLSNQKGA